MRWTCSQCGMTWRTDTPNPPVFCSCGKADRDGSGFTDDSGEPVEVSPTLIDRGIRYMSALARWTLAGWPVRTDEEVEEIFRNHCQLCQWFRDSTCTHAKCGCQIRSVEGEKDSIIGIVVAPELSNKIRWATESCPAEKWK